MKVYLYEIKALTDDLEITQSFGNPHILNVRFEIAGVEFSGQISADIAGVYSITVLNPTELFSILRDRKPTAFGESLNIKVPAPTDDQI